MSVRLSEKLCGFVYGIYTTIKGSDDDEPSSSSTSTTVLLQRKGFSIQQFSTKIKSIHDGDDLFDDFPDDDNDDDDDNRDERDGDLALLPSLVFGNGGMNYT